MINMKRLQSNFTTVEQSKRLLELGLPANSADCYYDWYGMKTESRPYKVVSVFNGDDTFSILKNRFKRELLPCWSVGRLIEILCICKKGEEVSFYTWNDKVDLVEWMIYKIEVAEPDFSKLDELYETDL